MSLYITAEIEPVTWSLSHYVLRSTRNPNFWIMDDHLDPLIQRMKKWKENPGAGELPSPPP